MLRHGSVPKNHFKYGEQWRSRRQLSSPVMVSGQGCAPVRRAVERHTFALACSKPLNDLVVVESGPTVKANQCLRREHQQSEEPTLLKVRFEHFGQPPNHDNTVLCRSVVAHRLTTSPFHHGPLADPSVTSKAVLAGSLKNEVGSDVSPRIEAPLKEPSTHISHAPPPRSTITAWCQVPF